MACEHCALQRFNLFAHSFLKHITLKSTETTQPLWPTALLKVFKHILSWMRLCSHNCDRNYCQKQQKGRTHRTENRSSSVIAEITASGSYISNSAFSHTLVITQYCGYQFLLGNISFLSKKCLFTNFCCDQGFMLWQYGYRGSELQHGLAWGCTVGCMPVLSAFYPDVEVEGCQTRALNLTCRHISLMISHFLTF